MAEAITIRTATPADWQTMLTTVHAGFATFREFAPAGWEVPDREPGAEVLKRRLPEPQTWGALALDGDDVAGHVAFYPDHERKPGEPPDVTAERPLLPGVAYLWQLFVREGFWGAGVATTLHDAALAEMRVRGYRQARLFTPAAHARARRFYEREGWAPPGRSGFDESIALEVVEYRLDL